MSWLQIGALVGVVVFAIIRLNVWKYLKPAKKPQEPQRATLAELVIKLKSQEDIKAWQRMLDIASN